MRRILLAPVLLAAVLVPSASACTLDNCVEVRTASASWNGTDLHSLDARCVVAGRAGMRFTVTAVAYAREGLATPADYTTVRCVVRNASGVVFDRTVTTGATVSAFTADFVSGPNVSACVSAVAYWNHGDYVETAACD